jgi:hypothetical protein
MLKLFILILVTTAAAGVFGRVVLKFEANNVADIQHSNYRENYAILDNLGFDREISALTVCLRFTMALVDSQYIFKSEGNINLK